MEQATKSQVCDDTSRANYANRLLSRAIHERRKPDTVTGRIFGMFAKNEKTVAEKEIRQIDDESKSLAGAGKR